MKQAMHSSSLWPRPLPARECTMGTVHIPKVMRDNVLMYFGDRGRDWLDRLPALLREVARQWSLQVFKQYPDPSINFVAPVKRRDGSDAVLKLGVPDREISTEIEALSCFGGEGAVILLGSDPALGMLLLEKLTPGTALYEASDSPAALEIAAGVMKALWKAPPEGHSFPTVGDWFSGLSEVRSRFDGGTGPFPSRLFERAEALSREMLDSTRVRMLLHGDCHHHNILNSCGRGWLAIDPKGVVGDPVFELCAYLRNPLDLHERFDVAKTLPGRVHRFAEILGLEPRRIASWGLAESILSAGWNLDGDPAFIRNSVEMAELYGKMLR